MKSIKNLILILIISCGLNARTVEWPAETIVLLKVTVGEQMRLCAIPSSCFKDYKAISIAKQHCTLECAVWAQAVQLIQSSGYPYTLKITHEQETEQVHHVCCVSILHGTCAHQANIQCQHPVHCEDGLIISDLMAQELGIEILDEEELLDYTQTQQELDRLNRFGPDVPTELIATPEPPSRLTIMVRKFGIATLLFGVQTYECLKNCWHSFVSASGWPADEK